MSPRTRARGAVVAALLLSAAAATGLTAFGPGPSADVSRGTEGLYAQGLWARELSGPDRRPQRWTTGRTVLRFQDLSPGPLHVTIGAHGHRSTVFVSVNGAVLATIEPGRRRAEIDVPAGAGARLDVELRVEPFGAGSGRRLGTLLDRVLVTNDAPIRPSPRVLIAFGAPALCAAAGSLLVGLGAPLALALAAAVSVLQALALAPGGAVHSSYASSLSLILCGLIASGLAFARWTERRQPGAARWAFPSLLLAGFVQVVAGCAPTMVVSDAEFHAHMLTRVAHGELFPTSLTPGQRPFRFPYGVSFYALLAPLEWAGVEPVDAVRAAAGISGLVASAGLFLLLRRRSPRQAGLATIVLQLLPVTFDLFSFGNLSNIFGQAATVAFFVWWTGPSARGVLGGGLLALACLAHLSPLIVLAALAAALFAVHGRSLLGDRARIVALAIGFAAAGAYYAHFIGLVAGQLPRLAEGSGGGGSLLGGLVRQAILAGRQWGPAAMLLAIAGRPSLEPEGLDRGLLAFWLAGLALALVAAVSPLEVRYLHALTLPLAVAAGAGLDRLLRAGWGGRLAALGLLAWQGTVAAGGILEGVLHRYRPS